MKHILDELDILTARHSGWTAAVKKSRDNTSVPIGSYHREDNGLVLQNKAAAFYKAVLESGLSRDAGCSNGGNVKPLMSLADALGAGDAKSFAAMLLVLSWVPSQAMHMEIPEAIKHLLGDNFDLVQAVSSTMNDSGDYFYSLKVLDVLLKHLDGKVSTRPPTDNYPICVVDAAPINTRSALAYGQVSNERSDDDHFRSQITGGMQKLVELMAANQVAGGCNVVAQTTVARMLCGGAWNRPGVVVPLSSAGDGYEIVGIPLDGRVAGHLRILGEYMHQFE